MKQAQFHATAAEANIIDGIVERAIAKGLCEKQNRLNLEMDITACHCSGTPLKLRELLEAADFDFTHDVCGISRYLNRITGELHDHFLPRYAKPEGTEYVKLTKQGVCRVLDGKEGDVFPVSTKTHHGDGRVTVHVLDASRASELRPSGQIWSLGQGDYEYTTMGAAVHQYVLEKTGAHMFPILDPATNKTELKEPTAGKWYCGFDDDDRDGLICQYVGDGEFQDDDGGYFDMGGYDYLVEQNGASGEAMDRIKAKRGEAA